MNVLKVIEKGIIGFVSGAVATVASNPEAITTLAGTGHAAEIGAVVALITAFSNWYKHRNDSDDTNVVVV